MYYEINVAKNGEHFFATAERSITTEAKLQEVLTEIVARFSKKDGYKISITKWSTTGMMISPIDILINGVI